MTTLTVTTQAELDKALANGVTDLIVDAPNGAWLEIRHDGLARVWESSRVVAYGSSRVVAYGSSHVEAYESSRVEAHGSSRVEAHGSSRVEAGRWTCVHLWSQRVTLTGEGHLIDMAKVDLTDLDTWREYVGADRPADPDVDVRIIGKVSSEDREGLLSRDGQISIGCWHGTPAELRELAASDDWPSGANADRRAKHAPRLLAFADLCDAQIAAWAGVTA